MVVLKEIFEKVNFEKSQQPTKKAGKCPRGQRVNNLQLHSVLQVEDLEFDIKVTQEVA